MTLWSHRRGRPITQQCVTLLLWLLSAHILFAQDPSDDGIGSTSPAAASIEQRIYELEQRQSELIEQNRVLSRRLQDLSSDTQQRLSNESDSNGAILSPFPSQDNRTTGNGATFSNNVRSPAEVFPSPAFDTALEFPLERKSSLNSGTGPPRYYVGYDRGFVFRPVDPVRTRFGTRGLSESTPSGSTTPEYRQRSAIRVTSRYLAVDSFFPGSRFAGNSNIT